MSTSTTTPCPSRRQLRGLIDGQLPPTDQTVLTDHVGVCVGCQQQLDVLAASGDERFSEAVRHANDDPPPADSAYWKALNAAEDELARTAAFAGGPDRAAAAEHPSGDLKLDFLRPAAAPNLLGKLGDFDILRVVGRGGMGVVLHGFDPCLHRDIAVKVLDPQLANNDVARQRFCREARAAAAVSHDNLVAVHQVDEDEASGLPYLIMQLIPGESLEQRLKRVGKMGVPEVARLGMQAAAGLAAAHAGGLIHRDIKPGNILLEDGADRVKLTDFGLARAAEDVKLTRTGFVAGTPLYMAPEQARGEEVDARADLFSLGSVLYEAATGKPPFDGKTPLAVLRRVADERHPPIREANPDVPDWMADIIDRLLEKDPADRFQTAAEVAEEFAAGLARLHSLSPLDVPAEVCPLSRTGHSRRGRKMPFSWRCVLRRSAPVAAGVIVGALAVGLWPSAVRHDPPPAAAAPAPADPGPPPRATLPGGGGPVWSASFGPDGQQLAMGVEAGLVKLWDLRDAAEPSVRRTIGNGHDHLLEGNVWAAELSPDGKQLLTATDNSDVKLWDLATYKTAVGLAHPTAVKSAAFSPDGQRVATGDRAGTIRVWNLHDVIPDELRSGHRGPVHALAFSPNGQWLVSAGGDSVIKVWSLTRTGVMQAQALEEHVGPVYGLAFSPDGTKFASAGSDKTVRVWDAVNGSQLHLLRGHDDDVWSVSFSSDGKLLASASGDKTAKVWDVATGRELLTLRPSDRALHAARFAPVGRTLAVGGRDGNVRIWDLTGR